MTEQIWLPIQGYEGLYEVSNFGAVRRLSGYRTLKNGVTRKEEGRLLKTHKRGRYICKTLSKEDVTKGYYVHRLVAQAFIPNLENKPYINHKDNNPLNNQVENLEWATQKENLKHAANQGRMSKPPINYVSPEKLQKAKELLEQGVRRNEVTKTLNISWYTLITYFGKAPSKVKKQSVDKSGKPQTTYVPTYPLDFAPLIKNAIELGFSS